MARPIDAMKKYAESLRNDEVPMEEWVFGPLTVRFPEGWHFIAGANGIYVMPEVPKPGHVVPLGDVWIMLHEFQSTEDLEGEALQDFVEGIFEGLARMEDEQEFRIRETPDGRLHCVLNVAQELDGKNYARSLAFVAAAATPRRLLGAFCTFTAPESMAQDLRVLRNLAAFQHALDTCKIARGADAPGPDIFADASFAEGDEP